MVLPQERRRLPSARVHWAPNRKGPRVMEEVGHPREGQEEDPRPHRCHPHPKGERPKEVGHHRGLPREEGGAIDDARAPTICDGARGIVGRNGACRGEAPQLQDRATHQGCDGAFAGECRFHPRLRLPSAGHPPMQSELGYIIFICLPVDIISSVVL